MAVEHPAQRKDEKTYHTGKTRAIMSGVFDIIQCKHRLHSRITTRVLFIWITHSCCAIKKSGCEIGIDGGLEAIDLREKKIELESKKILMYLDNRGGGGGGGRNVKIRLIRKYQTEVCTQ